MPHASELIGTIAVGLTAAFIGGLIAVRLRLPPIVGYVLAGIVVGPFTPGFVADAHLAPQLAEIGVIFLMFGVGLHFSLNDLLRVRRIALPGAIVQVAIATLLGVGITTLWGWPLGERIVFGLALSVASTVVLLRALESRNLIESNPGRVAVGWLVVEDLIMVIALVLLPALAPVLGGAAAGGATLSTTALLTTVGWTLLKVGAFVAIMLVLGVRAVPWILGRVEGTQSRELFVLATLAIALGTAYGAATLFGVSFALGAFLAGMVVNESELSHRAADEAAPLQDAFSVLFFVSVGMSIDPRFFFDDVIHLGLTLLIVLFGKAAVAIVLCRILGATRETTLTVAVGLSQIGEFSFILATMGMSLGLLTAEANNLILAAAVLSIVLNPFAFRMVDWYERRTAGHGLAAENPGAV